MVQSGKSLGTGVALTRGKLTMGPVLQETDSAGGAAPGPGGPGLVIPGALHVAWPRCCPLFIPGEWAWGPSSRPPCPPLALTHRFVLTLPCQWEDVERTRTVGA